MVASTSAVRTNASAQSRQSNAAAAPATVREGARGASVLRLQQALIKHGYRTLRVDGWFGPVTDRAVRAFQGAHGLAVDGVVGPKTWGKLLATPGPSSSASQPSSGQSSFLPSSAPAASTKPATGSPAKTTSSSPTLRQGAQGADVRKLQSLLLEHGFDPHGVDGSFGPKTRAAVVGFQHAKHLAANGVVDAKTWAALRAAPSKPSQPAPAPATGKDPGAIRANGWVKVKNFAYDHQDTGYTCGCSSLKMACSVFGLHIPEMTLASWAGTSSSSGTGHSGIFQAVKTVNQKYGLGLKAGEVSFKSVGWQGVMDRYTSKGYPVIVNLKSRYGNWGHYVCLAGLNMSRRTALVGDPSRGYVEVPFSELEWRMAWKQEPSLIPITR